MTTQQGLHRRRLRVGWLAALAASLLVATDLATAADAFAQEHTIAPPSSRPKRRKPRKKIDKKKQAEEAARLAAAQEEARQQAATLAAQQAQNAQELAAAADAMADIREEVLIARRQDGEAAAALHELRLKASHGLLPLPVVFYGPETGLGLGVFAMYYWHAGDPETTRSSNIRTTNWYTTQSQFHTELGPDLWLLNDAVHISPGIAYSNYPNVFFGIGDATSQSARETYTERSYLAQVVAQLRVDGDLYAGIRARLEHRDIVDVGRLGALANDPAIVGTNGGVVSGLGPEVTYDSRDNVYSTRRGVLLDIWYRLQAKAIGSDYNFGVGQIDAREFVPVPGGVLALEEVLRMSHGSTPFYWLSELGGGHTLRGIFLGRYRENHMLELQGEYRFPIFWRLGGTAFLGAGDVAHTLPQIATNPIHVAGGLGLRFAIVPAERINIRLDVAYGDGAPSYYLDVAEAF